MGDAVPAKVHWFSIVNSLLIVIFLSALVLMILIRAVYGDISRYNLRNDDVQPISEEQKVLIMLTFNYYLLTLNTHCLLSLHLDYFNA